MPYPKRHLRDRATAENNARRQAISLQQDVVTQDTNLAQQSGTATRRSTVASMVHPSRRTVWATATTIQLPTQNSSAASSDTQPAPLDASTRPRAGSIGPSRTARQRLMPPLYMAARGKNVRPNTPRSTSAHGEHPEAGSSRMAEAQQERKRGLISYNREGLITDQEDDAPQDSPTGLPRQKSRTQASAQCLVDSGERIEIYWTPQAHTVRTAVDTSAPGPLTITLIDVTPRGPVLDMHKIRTALARQLIEAAMTRVPKPDGTYDFSDAAGINRTYVDIARTGGEWRSEFTFLRRIPTTDKALADAWEAARVAAIAEIVEAHTGGNGV